MKRAWTVTCAPGPSGEPVPLSVVASSGPPWPLHGEVRMVTITLPRSASSDEVLAAARDAASALPSW